MHRLYNRRRRSTQRISDDLFWLALKVGGCILLLALCWSLMGTLLSLTLGQVLLLGLAFGAGWWLRGQRG
jgi:hypothetical protein